MRIYGIPGAFILALAAFTQEPAAVKKTQFSWTDMIWRSATVGGRFIPHAILAVEFKLDGMDTPASMQLDLGSDATMVYGTPYRQLRRSDSAAGESNVLLSGAMAGHRFQAEKFYVRPNFGDAIVEDKPVKLGTVGLDFFAERVLLLDFVKHKIAILEKGAALPADFAQRIDFVPIEYRNSKMFVTVTINGREERGLFYDTGSSSFPLMTTRGRWLEWTGRQPNDPKNEVWTMQSWGKDAPMIGAPMRGALCIAKACIDDPTVYFESSGLENMDFDKYPFKASGLFGNVPFDGKFTVVVDVPHRRFGLVSASLAEAAAK